MDGLNMQEADKKLILHLSYPPSVNHYLIASGNRRFLTQRAKDFRQHVLDEMPLGWTPFVGRLSLHIDVYPPDCRVRDIDNVVKQIQDSLEHAGAFVNDSQIDKLVVIRRDVIPRGGKVIITVETLCAL
jgi:crossover junction endodeoxyribonuclease RusA